MEIRTCTRCLMDSTVKGIVFDSNGECTFCKIHDDIENKYPLNAETPIKLRELVEKIKSDGKNQKYDCIVGVSGGRDSTYTLYNAVKLGLRPLAFHFDNGWNSEIAVENIKQITDKLGVDLYTHVADWEEFKDLQRAFLYASVPDAEVPTDWVITSLLYEVARKEKVKYFIGGHSFRTEGTTPLTWTYQDARYINDIHKIFGKKKIKSFPIMSMSKFVFYSLFSNTKYIRLLYYYQYDEKKVIETLKREVGWRDYGGKHFESTYTSFFQSYILPKKFNIDKRRLHYSALVRSGQISREEANASLAIEPFVGGEELVDYNLKKLGISKDEFEKIMLEKPKSFLDYKSYYPLIKKLRLPIKIAIRLGLIPEVIYYKYFLFEI